jgi:aminomethyltransferase
MLNAPPVMIAETPLAPLLASAAFAVCDEVGWIRIAGDDRVRWLNGMATNSIQALRPGEACYNFFLNAQGRIQGDATAWMLEDAILLETSRERIPALIAMLDHFIIMDDVELQAVEDYAGLVIAGPDAERVLANLGLGAPAEALSLTHASFNGSPVDLLHAYSPLVPRFEVWGKAETIAVISAALSGAIPQASNEALEQLRLLEGTPLYGIDIRDRDLPQETAQTRALHFAKGCYLGQEIVERIRSRGNVHRTLTGFLLSGDLPAAGTVLTAAGAPDKPLGELTSVSRIDLPTGPIALGLGIVRREALERTPELQYPGGTATPTHLPYALSI